ncbi:MAG: hypothetical protein ACRCVX_16385 [Shewanella sp.]
MKFPKKHADAFIAHMEAHNHEDLPDGAWFQCLEDAAEEFMKENKIKGCANSAAHEYLIESNKK